MSELEELRAEVERLARRVADLKMALGDGAGWFDRARAAERARDALRADLAKAQAESLEWERMAECQTEARPEPCHGPGKKSGDWCRLCTLAEYRRAALELEKAQAAAAAMREALEAVKSMHDSSSRAHSKGSAFYDSLFMWCEYGTKVDAALASDAGRALLEEVEALRKRPSPEVVAKAVQHIHQMMVALSRFADRELQHNPPAHFPSDHCAACVCSHGHGILLTSLALLEGKP